jgi:hypothetical protein
MSSRTRLKLAAILFGTIAAFVGGEVVLRVLDLGYGNSPVESDPFLHHVHPASYRFIQRHPSGELGGFETIYDAERRVVSGRPARTSSRGTGGECRIALVGDSFVEAGQVPYPASFPGILEEAARDGCTVKNFGVRSYSPTLYLVQWTREIQAWRPTHVFVLLFSNDITDDRGYLAVASRDAQGWPVAVPGPGDDWLQSQLRRLYVARMARTLYMQATWAWEHRNDEQMRVGGIVEENPPWEAPSSDFVAELSRRVRASGARFTLMVVPSRYRLMGDGTVPMNFDLHHRVAEWATAQGIGFLDLNVAFEKEAAAGVPLFFRQDIHFNEAGHALAARVIAQAFPDLFSRRP